MKRRLFVASSLGALGLGGCSSSVKDTLTSALTAGPLKGVFSATEALNHRVIGTRGMAKLYGEADIDRNFRVNGNDPPQDSQYLGLAQDAWSRYKLVVDGLVETPLALTLAALRAMPLTTQITRHDCVEGWSAIGKWRGVPLGDVIARARPTSAARFAIFSCYDRDEEGSHYYESLDLVQAAHPQTLLALDLNDAQLDPAHGAPVRLRIPTQLGYKSAKWVHRIQLAANFTDPGLGKGGYWEDQGYEWYAGI
jgi:DMSO/TMAO reductase YedYZ molybdopterin-dependent catalytic subunit